MALALPLCGCVLRPPPPRPLRTQEPIDLAVLSNADPLWDPFMDALARETARRGWSVRLWTAGGEEGQRAETERWQARAPRLALIIPASESRWASWRPETTVLSSLALMGCLDGAGKQGPSRLTWLREVASQEVAQEVMTAMLGVDIERPVLLYLGREGNSGRRQRARRRFLETARAQGGRVGFLLTDADRRNAKAALKARLLPSPATATPPAAAEESPAPAGREVHTIYAEDEELTRAMLDAMVETGLRPPLLIGTGAHAELAEAVRSGQLDGLVAYLPEDLAFQVVEWLETLPAGDAVSSHLAIEPLFLTSENVDLLAGAP